jgi:D-glycero-D-manno-heptose 1,7-bisphosphate phosphatase
MNKAVFLDRDGVINRKPVEGEYITRWEEIQFLPGVVEAIGRLNRSKFRVIVVSNQRCVAKGLVTAVELEGMHRRMCEQLAAAGATIDGVYYCPHEKWPACSCRKPAPGMLLEAARTYQLDLAASWMIGDSAVDIEAGKNAGCKTARLLGSDMVDGKADLVAFSLGEVADKILRFENDTELVTVKGSHSRSDY